MIIAVTRNDEINMLICQIAYTVFKISKKIARIRSQDYLNPKFSNVYNKENLPIDVIISPEIEIAKSIQRKLEAPGALDNVPFAESKIRLLEINVNKNCPLIGIKLNDLTKKFPKLEAKFKGKEVTRPSHWGGYCIDVNKIEFWQGRPSRFHDRVLYEFDTENWSKRRLAP